MIHAFIALVSIQSADVTYKVMDVETRTVRVARYGTQRSDTLTLERNGQTITIKLTNMTERFQGRRNTFSVGDSVSYDRELKSGMVIDRNSLRKS
ncbi:MAG: hypothetical protein KF784_11630 [Fimbriimonadaceae bacterium]|nr:hypothetical protein [Fimbriimonadaceae bacterium]